MFTSKLFDFQEIHKENLLRHCAELTENNNEMILEAPTGSGKTVLLSSFIDDYLDENPNTVFLWLCPGAGGLQKQSQETFEEMVSGIETGDVYDFVSDISPQGKVFFINWDKINRASNTVLQEGEQRDLFSRFRYCRDNGINQFVIVDEEHKYRDTANEYINIIAPVAVIRASATPIRTPAYKETITDEEVIREGLIAEGISINEGVSRSLEENNNIDDDLLLIELADKKRKEILEKYTELNINVRPLVIIQFPNGNEDWIERVKIKLESMGYGDSSGLTTSWFSGDHPDNPEELQKLNGEYNFLLFKQAVATGWDCPRAKILVKLREGGNETFNIQTVGRIRRMPERKHYGLSLLDNCYLYTLDSEFSEGLTSSLNEAFFTYEYKRKNDFENVVLTSECLDGSDRYTTNPEAVVKTIRKALINYCDINKDNKLDIKEMEKTKGFVFGTVLKTTAFEGVARTTRDMLSLNTVFGGEHEIDTHEDGFILRDAKRKIASAIGIDENISSQAFKVLFAPINKQISLLSEEEEQFEKENKLIEGMNLREYNAFLINNRDRIIDIVKDIDESEINSIEETDILEKEWSIPTRQYYKHHKYLQPTKTLHKNVFENYKDNILVNPNRTYTEVQFENWSENSNKTKWIYKNGDKGEDYFRIVYRAGFRRYHFYPDYIIKDNKDRIWIIEAKGGVNKDGESNNVDAQAKHKFEALKEYATKHNDIQWCFVRAVGGKILASNTIWDESVFNDNVWKDLEEIIN